MQGLLTKEGARDMLQLRTTEAAERLLHRLGVPKINYALIGGKGVRYRKSDILEALAKITVDPNTKKKTHRPKRPASNIFDLPVNEQIILLTGQSPTQ